MKRIFGFFIVLIILFNFTACYKNTNTKEYPVEVFDEKIQSQPISVVSLSPSLTEITYDLGFELTLDGVSEYSVMRNDNDAIKVGTVQNPDIDEIIEIKPNVVITNAPLTAEDTNKLYQADINIVVVPVAKTVDELWQQYDIIGTIYSGKYTGVQRAREKYERYKQKLENISEKTKLYGKLKGLLVAKKDYAIATGDTLLGNLLDYIGINNIANEGKEFNFNNENFNKAEIIFISDDINVSDINSNPKFKNSPAVKNKKVYKVNIDTLLRGGFNALDILEEMSNLAFGTENSK